MCARSVLTAIAFLAWISGGLLAQEARVEPEKGKVLGEGSEAFTIQGQDLPRYFAVRGFFQLCNQALRFEEGETLDEEAFYFTVPFKMGIPAEADAVQDILQAAQQADIVLRETLDVGPFGSDEEASRRAQVEFKRREVRRIAKIYFDMLVKLKKSGIDPATVETFIDQQVTPTVTMVTSRPISIEEDEILQVTITEFEAVLLTHGGSR